MKLLRASGVRSLGVLLLCSLVLSACLAVDRFAAPSLDAGQPENGRGTIEAGRGEQSSEIMEAEGHQDAPEPLRLPNLEAPDLAGAKLSVVATTSIIGDVVAAVGGEMIDLTILMRAGVDPHSYIPAADDFVAVSEAHVIFINGWNLEEGLIQDLEAIRADTPLVPVSAGVKPLALRSDPHDADGADHIVEETFDPNSVDPHTWESVGNVRQWVENILMALSALDPGHAASYRENAAAYREALEDLETYVQTQVSKIPAERRVLVTNHDSLRYFAREYGFEIIGTVLPANSTLSEPSASEIADLIMALESRHACTLFTETTASDRLARAVAAELDGCDEVKLLALHTGALGPAGSGAETYIDMFRYNIDQIVVGLLP